MRAAVAVNVPGCGFVTGNIIYDDDDNDGDCKQWGVGYALAALHATPHVLRTRSAHQRQQLYSVTLVAGRSMRQQHSSSAAAAMLLPPPPSPPSRSEVPLPLTPMCAGDGDDDWRDDDWDDK